MQSSKRDPRHRLRTVQSAASSGRRSRGLERKIGYLQPLSFRILRATSAYALYVPPPDVAQSIVFQTESGQAVSTTPDTCETFQSRYPKPEETPRNRHRSGRRTSLQNPQRTVLHP